MENYKIEKKYQALVSMSFSTHADVRCHRGPSETVMSGLTTGYSAHDFRTYNVLGMAV